MKSVDISPLARCGTIIAKLSKLYGFSTKKETESARLKRESFAEVQTAHINIFDKDGRSTAS